MSHAASAIVPLPTTDYTAVDRIVDDIISVVIAYMDGISHDFIRSEIRKAYIFARDAHEGQMRKSGDPYIIHPVETAKILTILKPDIITLQCAFLHDVAEDTEKTVQDIENVFGPEVAHIVSGMEKLSKVKYR